LPLRKLWLTFAQTVTVAVGLLFVVTTLKPEWLTGLNRSGGDAQVVALRETAPSPTLPARSNSYSEAVQRAVPAVVNIYTAKEARGARHPFLNDPLFRQFFGENLNESQRSQGLGSGVIVSDKGYILTNQHVVEAADEIEVALSNGRRLKARPVGSDPDTDLAVLQVDASDLPAITFGDDAGLKLGDVVLAIGNPFGIGQTVTMGIVSGLGRTPGINTFENFIQTDAAINPGNSGGALVDAHGNLVGINTAIYSRSGGSLGIGFAIPASSAKQVLESIISSGSVSRGWIGVEPREVSIDVAESLMIKPGTGILIAGVVRGGPADAAGIKPGDVLVSLAGKPVSDPTSMRNLVAGLAPGSSATATLRRDQKDVELRIDIGKRPRNTARR
jgi:serine protease DegQ